MAYKCGLRQVLLLIKDYDREYLGGIDKYPKTFQDAYNLLKGWNKHKKSGQKHPPRVGVSFNTVGEEKGKLLSMMEQSIHHAADVVSSTTQWTNVLLRSA